jgi:spore coat polysaccharide biosynthesis predicted glycosyltransferase SpsG
VSQDSLKKKKNILICPLEWGLGHAGRMIPLARKLRDMDHNILIAGGAEQLSFFRSELQGLSYVKFPGFRPGYSRMLPQYLVLLLQTPVLLYHIVSEHIRLRRIIKEYNIDIVISDNRFGLWNRNVKTAYVTHMPLIPFPKPFTFLEFTGIFLHRLIIKRFNFCFIPDLPGELNVSGRLSHGVKLPGNTRFIGILSRFNSDTPIVKSLTAPLATVILSGPEPQRSVLKNILNELLSNRTTAILEGRPGLKTQVAVSGNITTYNHLGTSEMKEKLLASGNIITRAGYTTIMELISLNCSALLIPTPGQTEQEYLAGYLSQKGWFSTVSQRDINGSALQTTAKNNQPVLFNKMSEELLDSALQDLLQ